MSRLLGYVSIFANLLLGLACCALGILGWISGHDLEIPLVPVAPESVATALFCAGLFAIVAVVMALGRKNGPRLLLVVWSLVIAGLLVAAFFRGSYTFDGMDGFKSYGWYLLASLVLLAGSWLHFRSPVRRSRDY